MEQERTQTFRFPVFNWWWLAVIVALVCGLAAGVVVRQPPAENSPAVAFSRDMVAHHTQAVALALAIRERSSDPALRQFALDIVLTQQGQIGQMQGWLAAWGRPLAGETPPMYGMTEQMGMATPEQVDSLNTLPIEEAEATFLQLMIRHHQGGVAMAEDVLKHTSQPEVVRLAQAIIAGQQSEIEYMKGLLTERGAALPEDLPPHSGMY